MDGIVDDYKASKLPLIHQHLQNVENRINPMKTIWIFDRGYTAMELYARIIEMNSYFIVRLRKDSLQRRKKKHNERRFTNLFKYHWKQTQKIP